MCTVDVIGQREAMKYGCTDCVKPSGKCVQCVQVEGAGSDMIGQCEVSSQVSHKSRSKKSIQGGGNIVGQLLEQRDILEHKGRGESFTGKQASISHTDQNTFPKIV